MRPMKPVKSLATLLRDKMIARKQDVLFRFPAQLGNVDGDLFVGSSTKMVYARTDDFHPAIPVYCDGDKISPYYNQKVWVGYTAANPNLLQVIEKNSATPGGVGFDEFDNSHHGKRHEWLGPDPVHVYGRALMPLGLYCTNPSSMSMTLYHGIIWSGTEFLEVPDQTLNFSAQIPATSGKAAIVLVTINTSGIVVQTKGSEVDLDVLFPEGNRFANVPNVPDATVFVCGMVRVYEGQSAIQEGITNRDIVDPRFPGIGTYGALTDAPSNGNTYARKDGAWFSLSGAIAKDTPVSADSVLLVDSEDANTIKTVLISNLPGGGSGDLIGEVAGGLAVTTNAAPAVIVTKDTTVESWYIYLKTTGSAGSTIVDINKNGTTIFTTQANRPTLAYDDANGWAVSGTPDVTDFVEGDIITFDIDQIATGATNLSIAGSVASTGSGTGTGEVPPALNIYLYNSFR